MLLNIRIMMNKLIIIKKKIESQSPAPRGDDKRGSQIIDDEIRSLADEADKNCRKILQDNIEELHIVAKGLLEYETLSGNEIKDLIKGIKPSRDDFDDSPTPNPTPKTSVPKTGETTAPQTN